MIRKPMTKIQKILFENQDLKYRDFHSKLMPTVEKEKIIGVRIPILRSLAKDLYKNEPELVKEFLENSSENHPHEFYEENNLHAFFLEQIKKFLVAHGRCIRYFLRRFIFKHRNAVLTLFHRIAEC